MKWEYNREQNRNAVSAAVRTLYHIFLWKNDLLPRKESRAYPGVERGSVEWDETYKIRVNVEKSISRFKDSFCVAGRKPKMKNTTCSLLLAGISQLITVMVADKIHQHQYIRSLKPLIA